MRPVFSILFGFYLLFPLASSAWAQSARDFCPDAITPACLQKIADYMIKNTPEDRGDRAKVAINFAQQIVETDPELARAMLQEYASGVNRYALLSLAEEFAKHGLDDAVRETLIAIRQNQVDNPNPEAQVADLLLIANDMAEAGHLDLAKETHIIAIKFLPGKIEAWGAFFDETRLARSMALYGWPEEAEPWFSATYDRIDEMPEASSVKGFTLSLFLEVSKILGNTALTERAKQDLEAFYKIAPLEEQKLVQKSEVGSLAEAGLIEEAKAKATAYGITLAEVLQSGPALFLNLETDYEPGIFPDTLNRYEKMIEALETQEAKDEFVNALAEKLRYKKMFPEVEALLPRIKTPLERGDMVLALMSFYSRDRNEPLLAADLYFSEKPDFGSKFNPRGTSLIRYPLSLTAIGLWQKGDQERAKILTDEVFQLWLADVSDTRDAPTLLVKELAKVGQDEIIENLLSTTFVPKDRIEVLNWASRGKAESGDFDASLNYLSRAKEFLPQIPNVSNDNSLANLSPAAKKAAMQNLKFANRGQTEQEEATQELDDTYFEIIAEMARHDELKQAQSQWAKVEPENKTSKWPIALEIARAEGRAGNKEAEQAMKLSVLDQLLSGKIPYWLMPPIVSIMAKNKEEAN